MTHLLTRFYRRAGHHTTPGCAGDGATPGGRGEGLKGGEGWHRGLTFLPEPSPNVPSVAVLVGGFDAH